MKKIPFTRPIFDNEELENIKKVLDSGFVGQGHVTKLFEKEFSEFIGTKFGIATNSGTTAIQTALEGIGLNPGEEVIVPAVSFVASGNAVIEAKGKPIFVDVDKKTYNIDPSKIEEKITSKTKVICPVHLLGIPADIKPIQELCKKHNLEMVEDCALAHGAEYNNKKVGTFGDASIFSFYGSKIMVTGEGGMITTDNEAYAEKMKLLRSHGNNPNKKFDHLIFGYSYQMSNINAAIGRAQLKKLPYIIKKRRENAKLINKMLEGVEGIQLCKEKSNTKNAWFGYPIVITDNKIKKENVIQKLNTLGIETRPLYYVIPNLKFYREEYGGKFPNAEFITKNGFFVSCSPILNKDEIIYMCEHIKKSLRQK